MFLKQTLSICWLAPLAEARYVAANDGEVFNEHLVSLKALHHYGGSSYLAIIQEYLESYSVCNQQRDEKLNELFSLAVSFIKRSKQLGGSNQAGSLHNRE